eukprot:8108827-Pyramimonas_sp.AAC.1
MLPPRQAGDNDDTDDNKTMARLKVRKKAWRAKCTFEDPEKRTRILLMNWMGAPVEKMMSNFQYLDRAGKGLYDAS